MARYLEEKYVAKGDLPKEVVFLLDRFGNPRHTDLYRLDFFASEDEAREAIKSAEFVIGEITRILEAEG